MRFDQCGAVMQDCNSALLDAIQEKTTQHFRANTAEPEAAKRRLDEYVNTVYAVCFPLNNKINTTNPDSGVKAAVKNAQALQFGTLVKSSHVKIIYIVLYAIDSLKSSGFTASVLLLVRITTWPSVIKQLSSVELANDKIFLLAGKKNSIALKL